MALRIGWYLQMHRTTFRAVHPTAKHLNTTVTLPIKTGDTLYEDVLTDELFWDDHKNYKNVYDEFNRPLLHNELWTPRWSNTPRDYTSYLCSQDDLQNMTESSFQEWKDWILSQLLLYGELRNAFADGSVCQYVQRRFLKLMGAETLYSYVIPHGTLLYTEVLSTKETIKEIPARVLHSSICTFKAHECTWVHNRGDIHRIV